MRTSSRMCTIGAAIATLVMAGACANNEPADQRDVSMSVETSSHEILAGELVTLTAKTQNTLGRESSVRWLATGGDVKTEDNGRIARITFKKPGTYTVTARLYVGDRVMREDTVDIHVKPVP